MSSVILGISIPTAAAQKPKRPKVVAAFGFECQTNTFPRRKLRKLIQTALARVKNEGASGVGEYAVGYDLDGDGAKEYFAALRDMGVGDNYIWGVFSVKPARYLGLIRAERIYIHRRVGRWPVLSAHWHESVSESYISTFSFRKGKYQESRKGFLVSTAKNNEPEYSRRTKDLYICDRGTSYQDVANGDKPIKPMVEPKAEPK